MAATAICVAIHMTLTVLVCSILGIIGLLSCNMKTVAYIDTTTNFTSYIGNDRNISIAFAFSSLDELAAEQNTSQLDICYYRINPWENHILDDTVYFMNFYESLAMVITAAALFMFYSCICCYVAMDASRIHPTQPQPVSTLTVKPPVNIPMIELETKSRSDVMIGTSTIEDSDTSQPQPHHIIIINPI